MTEFLGKWKRLTLFQRVLIVIACILTVLVAARYVDVSRLALPLPDAIEKQENELRDLQQRLSRLDERNRRQQEGLGLLRQTVQPYLWRLGDTRAETEIQAELERLARAERITIRTMGSPRITDVTEHVRSVEISLNLVGSMREISRFLAAVEASDRKFYWTSCRLRPNNVRNVESVNLTGRVEALFLTPDAEYVIFGRQG